ncbi:uncharacterized protein LOC129945233 [Eupeodes corollae]|uniref:uncharacterized protein LOC129945233 n=1 Tax=Eupeodes corollae TaxID=290404 RepID=UPI0024912B91|nr:uncharacterized protein LOC129945233 [Eupeodes corollae]
MAYWLLLRSILQFKVIQKKLDIITPLPAFSLLSTHEIKTVTTSFVRWVQQVEFAKEFKSLKTSKSVNGCSKLSSLFPFIDGDGILRVGGRLHNSLCNFDAQHLVILPKKHLITSLLIDQYHKRYLHPGPTLLLSIMRQRYWIIGGRSTIRHYIYKCLNCFRLKRIKQQQLMGSLPEKRLHPSRPFLHCGVDYAGLIKIRLNKGRGAKTSKGYIALYVCFSTKAIHVEMVSDLTTDAFIASLKRFILRRGIPAGIYSDNGTNFIGAKRKLSELYKMVLSTDFNNILSTFLSKTSASGTSSRLFHPTLADCGSQVSKQ